MVITSVLHTEGLQFDPGLQTHDYTRKQDTKQTSLDIEETCWVLWKERNARTFKNEAKDARELCLEIRQEADLWLRAGYSTLSSLTSFM